MHSRKITKLIFHIAKAVLLYISLPAFAESEECLYYVRQDGNAHLRHCAVTASAGARDDFKCRAVTQLKLFDQTIDASGNISHKNPVETSNWPPIKVYLYIDKSITPATIPVVGVADKQGQVVFEHAPCADVYNGKKYKSEFKYNLPNQDGYIPGWERVRTGNDAQEKDQYKSFFLADKNPQKINGKLTYKDVAYTSMTLGTFNFSADKLFLQISTPIDPVCKPLDKNNLKDYFHPSEITSLEDIYRQLRLNEAQIGEFIYNNQGVFHGAKWNNATVADRLGLVSRIANDQQETLKFQITNSVKKANGYIYGFTTGGTNRGETVSVSWKVADLKTQNVVNTANNSTNKLNICLFRNLAKINFKGTTGNNLFLGNKPDLTKVFKTTVPTGIIPELASGNNSIKLFLPYQKDPDESMALDFQSNPNYSGASDLVQVFNGKIQVSYTGQGVKIYPSGGQATYKPAFDFTFAKAVSFSEPVTASVDICLFDEQDVTSGAIQNPEQVACAKPLNSDFKFSLNGLKLERDGEHFRVIATENALNANGRELLSTFESRSGGRYFPTGLKISVVDNPANGNKPELYFEHVTANGMQWLPVLPKFRNRIYIRSSNVEFSYTFRTNLGDYDKYLINLIADNSVKFEVMNVDGTTVNNRIVGKLEINPTLKLPSVTFKGGTETERRNALKNLRFTADFSKSWLGVYFQNLQVKAYITVENKLMFQSATGNEMTENITFVKQKVDVLRKKIPLRLILSKVTPMPPSQGKMDIKFIPESGWNKSWKQLLPARDAIGYSQHEWLNEEVEAPLKEYKDELSFMVLPAFELQSVLEYEGYEPEKYYLNSESKSGKLVSLFRDADLSLKPDSSMGKELMSYLRQMANGEDPGRHALEITLKSEFVEPRTKRECSVNLFKDIQDPNGCISVRFGGKETRFCALNEGSAAGRVTLANWQSLSPQATCSLTAAAIDKEISEIHLGFHGTGALFTNGSKESTVSIWRIDGKSVGHLWRDTTKADSILTRLQEQFKRQKNTANTPFDSSYGTDAMKKRYLEKCESKGLCNEIFNDMFSMSSGGSAARLDALKKLGHKTAQLKEVAKLDHILLTLGVFSDVGPTEDQIEKDEYNITLRLKPDSGAEAERAFIAAQMSLVSPIDEVKGSFLTGTKGEVSLKIEFPSERIDQLYSTALDLVLFNKVANLKTIVKLKVNEEETDGQGDKLSLTYFPSGEKLGPPEKETSDSLFEVKPMTAATSSEDSFRIELVDHLNNPIKPDDLKPGGKFAGLSVESPNCIDLSNLNAVFKKKYTAEIVRDPGELNLYIDDKAKGEYAKLKNIMAVYSHKLKNVALTTKNCGTSTEGFSYKIDTGDKISLIKGATENSYMVEFGNKLKSNQLIVKKEKLLTVMVLEKNKDGSDGQVIKGLDLSLLIDGISNPLKYSEAKAATNEKSGTPASYQVDLNSLQLTGARNFQIVTRSNITGNAELGAGAGQNNILYNSIEAEGEGQISEIDFDDDVAPVVKIYLPAAKFGENEIVLKITNGKVLENKQSCFSVTDAQGNDAGISDFRFDERSGGLIATIAKDDRSNAPRYPYPAEAEFNVSINESCAEYQFSKAKNSTGSSGVSASNTSKTKIVLASEYQGSHIKSIIAKRSFRSDKSTTFEYEIDGSNVDLLSMQYAPAYFQIELGALPGFPAATERKVNENEDDIHKFKIRIVSGSKSATEEVESQEIIDVLKVDARTPKAYVLTRDINYPVSELKFQAQFTMTQTQRWFYDSEKVSGQPQEEPELTYSFPEAKPWTISAEHSTAKGAFQAQLRLIQKSFFRSLTFQVKKRIRKDGLLALKNDISEGDGALRAQDKEIVRLLNKAKSEAGKKGIFVERVSDQAPLSDRIYWASFNYNADLTTIPGLREKCTGKCQSYIVNEVKTGVGYVVLREGGKECFKMDNANKGISYIAAAQIELLSSTNACSRTGIYSDKLFSNEVAFVKWTSSIAESDHDKIKAFLDARVVTTPIATDLNSNKALDFLGINEQLKAVKEAKTRQKSEIGKLKKMVESFESGVNALYENTSTLLRSINSEKSQIAEIKKTQWHSTDEKNKILINSIQQSYNESSGILPTYQVWVSEYSYKLGSFKGKIKALIELLSKEDADKQINSIESQVTAISSSDELSTILAELVKVKFVTEIYLKGPASAIAELSKPISDSKKETISIKLKSPLKIQARVAEVPKPFYVKVFKANYDVGEYKVNSDTATKIYNYAQNHLSSVFAVQFPELYFTEGNYVNGWALPIKGSGDNYSLGMEGCGGENSNVISTHNPDGSIHTIDMAKCMGIEDANDLQAINFEKEPSKIKLKISMSMLGRSGTAEITKDSATGAWILADGSLPKFQENGGITNVIYVEDDKVISQEASNVSIETFNKILGVSGEQALKAIGPYSQFGSDCAGKDRGAAIQCYKGTMAGKLIGVFDERKIQEMLDAPLGAVGNTSGRFKNDPAAIKAIRKEYANWLRQFTASGDELKMLQGASALSRQLCYVTSNWLLGKMTNALPENEKELDGYILARLKNGDLGLGCTGGSPCSGNYTVDWADSPSIDYRKCSENDSISERRFNCAKPVTVAKGTGPRDAESSSRWLSKASQRKVLHGRISYNNPNKVTDDHSLILIKVGDDWILWDHTGVETRRKIADWENLSKTNAFYYGVGLDPSKKK